MLNKLKTTSILLATLSVSGCVTWPETEGTSSGPFSSAPPSTRGQSPQIRAPEVASQPAPSSDAATSTSALDSPVVVYRPQPRFEPTVVDSAPSQPTSPSAGSSDQVIVQRGSGGQGNAAVKSLVAKADSAYDRGDYEGAIAQLERAVRIEPRNGHVWYKMASLRMALQEPVKAESMAQKSLSYAGADKKLRADNWDLIAVTRRMRGDTPGANFAARQATLALQQR